MRKVAVDGLYLEGIFGYPCLNIIFLMRIDADTTKATIKPLCLGPCMNLRSLPVIFLWLLCSGHALGKIAELSYKSADGEKTLKIQKAEIDVAIQNQDGLITYILHFRNDLNRPLEGDFTFEVPEGSHIHEFGMWINDRYQKGTVVGAHQARRAYETISRRMVDPGLLEWQRSHRFKMRVFPISPTKTTRVKLVLGQTAVVRNWIETFTIPSDLGDVELVLLSIRGSTLWRQEPEVLGLGKDWRLKSRDLKTMVNFRGEYSSSGEQLPKEIKLKNRIDVKRKSWGVVSTGAKGQAFHAWAVPKLEAKPLPPADHVVVFWDLSHSGASFHKTWLSQLEGYLKLRQPKSIDFYGVRHHVTSLGQKLPRNFLKLKKIDFVYDGATRLDGVLAKIKSLELKPKIEVLIFTDGVDSYDGGDLGATLAKGGFKGRSYIIGSKLAFRSPTLQRMAQILGSSMIPSHRADLSSRFRESPWVLSKVDGPGIKQVSFQPQTIYPGDGISLRGLTKGKDLPDIQLSFKNYVDNEVRTFKLPLHKSSSDQLGITTRFWAKEQIALHTPKRRQHKELIQSLALEHQLLSPYTSMVVLETCDDYREFGIDQSENCFSRGELLNKMGGFSRIDSFSNSESFDFDRGNLRSKISIRPLAFRPSGPSEGDDLVYEKDDEYLSEDGYDDLSDVQVGEYEPDSEIDDPSLSVLSSTDQDLPAEPPAPFIDELKASKKLGHNKFYEQYLSLKGDHQKDPYFFILSAQIMMELGDDILAERILSNLIEFSPGDVESLRIFGSELLAMMHLNEAREAFQLVKELRPDDPRGIRDLAYTYERLKNYPVAFKYYYLANRKVQSRTIERDLLRVAKSLATSGLNSQKKTKDLELFPEDRMIVTVSWNGFADVSFEVEEPGGFTLRKDGKPGLAGSRLDYTERVYPGVALAEYRNKVPAKGVYHFRLEAHSWDQIRLSKGLAVRLDFQVTSKGQVRQFTKTAFLDRLDRAVNAYSITIDDQNAPKAKIYFPTQIAKVNHLLGDKKFKQALKLVESLERQKTRHWESKRLLAKGDALMGLKKYHEAELLADQATIVDPNLIEATFLKIRAVARTKNKAKALMALKLLEVRPRNTRRINRAIKNFLEDEPDLALIRGSSDFEKTKAEMMAH